MKIEKVVLLVSGIIDILFCLGLILISIFTITIGGSISNFYPQDYFGITKLTKAIILVFGFLFFILSIIFMAFGIKTITLIKKDDESFKKGKWFSFSFAVVLFVIFIISILILIENILTKKSFLFSAIISAVSLIDLSLKLASFILITKKERKK